LSQLFWKTDHSIQMALVSHKNHLASKQTEMKRTVPQFLSLNSKNLEMTGGLALSGLKRMIPSGRDELKRSLSLVLQTVQRRMDGEHHKIEMMSQEVSLNDPARILARGYSITTCNGKVLKDVADVQENETIQTILHKGTLVSKVLGEKESI
jgi:exonuclease VII large subunit